MPKVNPNILSWARETAWLTPEEATKKLQINKARGLPAVKRLAMLESGEVEPTRPMLLKMSKQYRRPLLTFYMSAPPRRGNRGQDFRTLPESYSIASDALLDALIRNVQARQSMVRAVLEDEEDTERLPFVGSVQISDGVPAVLEAIQNIIQVDLAKFRAQPSPEDAFAFLRSRVEAVGIFVLLIGNLGSHHSTIGLETFRGFALANDLAPFVIINDQDSSAAWSFTLLHELTHIWLGETGVSGINSEEAIEKFSNDVAGEFLLPSEELPEIDNATDFNDAKNIISKVAESRKVSSSMVAYRLFLKGSINRNTWLNLSQTFRELWLKGRSEKRRKAKKQGGGPDYYIVRRHRVGTSLISLVQRMMAEGALTTSKAGKVLGVKAKNVQSLIDTLMPTDIGRRV